MRGAAVLVVVSLLAGCASDDRAGSADVSNRSDAAAGSDVACIHRLWDLPTRTLPFPAAAVACAHGREPDLTGSPYFQTLARTANIAFTTRDGRPGSIALVGTRIASPVDQAAPPNTVLQ